MSELIGKTLGKFTIERELGRGGMGIVYQARHAELGRTVAIKVMHAQYTDDMNFRARFRQEAHIAAQLTHPGIVTVTDFDETEGQLYIIMEFIEGQNLQELLEQFRAQHTWLGLAEAIRLISQVGLALHYAHNKGVLHRDIKPSNIMIRLDTEQPGYYQPVITDLGLARLKSGGMITHPYSTMGTPAYMSPEQATGEATDPRSDVYSLGVLLYELVIGELPFPIQTITDAFRYHVREQPPAPRAKRAELPVALEQIILRAMAKEPKQRYASTAEMVQALSTIALNTLPTTAPPTAQTVTDIFTQVQEQMSRFSQNSWFMDFPPPPTRIGNSDLIQVLAPNGSHWFAPLHKTGLTVGREKDCSLKLAQDDQISRHHARIEWAGNAYRVTDLNSSNGVWLASRRLLPNKPESWLPEEPLRLGRHRLRLLRAVVPTAALPISKQETQPYYDNPLPPPPIGLSKTPPEQSSPGQVQAVPAARRPATKSSRTQPPFWVMTLVGTVFCVGLIALAVILRGLLITSTTSAPTVPTPLAALSPTPLPTQTSVTSAPDTVAPPTSPPAPTLQPATLTLENTPLPTATPIPVATDLPTATPIQSPTSPPPTSTPVVVAATATPQPTAPAKQPAAPYSLRINPTPTSALSKVGCYLIQNQLGPELTVTITRVSTQKSYTFKIASKQDHQICLEPGRYTFTVDAPPPWGTLNDTLEIHAGDNFYYPIRPGN